MPLISLSPLLLTSPRNPGERITFCTASAAAGTASTAKTASAAASTASTASIGSSAAAAGTPTSKGKLRPFCYFLVVATFRIQQPGNELQIVGFHAA